ncbi:DUF305 domain-containing protein [Rhodococcus aerolatus]
MKIRLAVPTAVAVLGFALAGCSSESSMPGMDMGSGSSSSTAADSGQAQAGVVFNDADVAFAQMMYPHHAQAVEMANLVQGRTQNQAVIDLATEISGAQGPEMTQMTELLASFGQPAPSADMAGMGGMSMNGMMTPEDMAALAAASGAEFDQRWLTMMVAHHTGAIEMANTELADGSNPDAKQLATDIVAAQQAEIETMNDLLQG